MIFLFFTLQFIMVFLFFTLQFIMAFLFSLYSLLWRSCFHFTVYYDIPVFHFTVFYELLAYICLFVKKLTWRLSHFLELFVLIPVFICSNVQVMCKQTAIGLCIFVNGQQNWMKFNKDRQATFQEYLVKRCWTVSWTVTRLNCDLGSWNSILFSSGELLLGRRTSSRGIIASFRCLIVRERLRTRHSPIKLPFTLQLQY